MAAARAGYRVLLEDVMPANLHHAREALRRELNAETLPAVDFVSTIEVAVREADLAIDCVPDELESKLEIFACSIAWGSAAHDIGYADDVSVHRRSGSLYLSRRPVRGNCR